MKIPNGLITVENSLWDLYAARNVNRIIDTLPRIAFESCLIIFWRSSTPLTTYIRGRQRNFAQFVENQHRKPCFSFESRSARFRITADEFPRRVELSARSFVDARVVRAYFEALRCFFSYRRSLWSYKVRGQDILLILQRAHYTQLFTRIIRLQETLWVVNPFTST